MYIPTISSHWGHHFTLWWTAIQKLQYTRNLVMKTNTPCHKGACLPIDIVQSTKTSRSSHLFLFQHSCSTNKQTGLHWLIGNPTVDMILKTSKSTFVSMKLQSLDYHFLNIAPIPNETALVRLAWPGHAENWSTMNTCKIPRHLMQNKPSYDFRCKLYQTVLSVENFG